VPRPASALIHADNLRHNLGVARASAAAARVMAVIKADGYGHGLERVARILRSADLFGVASVDDVRRVRAAGLVHPVLVLSGFDSPEDLPLLRQLGATTVVHSPHQLDMLEASQGGPIDCWLKVDSGMHRLGFAPGQVAEAHARLARSPQVGSEITLMTHFASSDEFAGVETASQMRVFEQATAGLPGPRSLANSAAVLGWPRSHGDIVRPGGMLYGMSMVAGTTGEDFGLRPGMTLRSRLLAVNSVAKGGCVGYAGAWQCPEDMPVGVVALGYGDGYPRLVAASTPVLLNGRPAPIIGRVSMDLMTIDLRGHPEVRAGDPVVAWGEGLPVDAVAAAAGTIGYELTCSVTSRVLFAED